MKHYKLKRAQLGVLNISHQWTIGYQFSIIHDSNLMKENSSGDNLK